MPRTSNCCIYCKRPSIYEIHPACLSRWRKVNAELDKEIQRVRMNKRHFDDHLDELYGEFEPFNSMHVDNAMGMTPTEIDEADAYFGAAMAKYGLVFENGPSLEQRRWRNVI